MAAPELRLNVSLDLGFFRQQLRQLSAIASSEFNAPLKVKFDKTTLNKELSLISSQLARRKYNIQINDTSIKTARLSAQKLKRTLDLLAKTKYTIDVGVRQSGVSASGKLDILENIFGRGKTGQAFDANAVGQARSNVSREALLKRLSAQSLGKGGYNIPGLERVITELGGTPSGNRASLVAQAKKLAESVDDALIDRVWSSVKDLQMNMRYSGGAGYGVGQRISKLINSMSLVSSDPRAARQQLRSLPPKYITTEMAGKASDQAMANTALGQTGAPVGAKFQNSFDKYLNSVVSQAMADAAHARQRYGLRQMGVNLSQKLLPPAGGTSGMAIVPHRTFAGPSTGRPIPVAGRGALALYERGGALSVSGGGGGGGGGGGMPPGGGTGGGPGNFAGRGGGPGGGFNMPNLPGAGLVREVGQEFAFATKQVLLFGTAYKALAFATSFPVQVGQAVAALQSFNNTLKAISPSAKEVQASNALILELVDKYNIPLQSARDGFTKLYASMQSAGFAGDQVRDIFTGISKAAATFGMSADKVDRVNYAFAQMASKGQVMSEELKGQLGDVLPGALGIFAEAAGFKGPDAIQKFSKALEDGAYKGQAMKQLLTNVGIVMNKEFGPGAEGAARTFQGAMNRMQNSLLLLYEAFEPAAVQFLNAVVMPLTNGIKQVTDGFNAFFTGQATKTAGGSALAQQLNELRPSFEGISNNIKELAPTFQLLSNILLGVAKAFTVIAGNPITGFLLKLYANVLLVNGVFTLLGGRVLVTLIGNISAAIARFVALNAAVLTTQRTAAVTNSTLAGTQLQMALVQRSAGMATGPVILLRNALLSIARIGIIAIGINVIINGLAEMDRLNKSLDEIGAFSSAKYRKEISGMSKEDINSRLIENRRTQAAIQKELGTYAGPLGSVQGLTTGRDEELRARLLMVQTKEQALIGANRTARPGVSLDSQVTGDIAPIALEESERGKKKAADDAKRLQEEIARQAAAASDALFTEQQRLLILKQTNPIAEAFTKYTSQELTIQRELNAKLKEAKSDKEKIDLTEAARLQNAASLLELQQNINDAGKQALAPIEDLLKSQREELFLNGEIEKLMREGMSPERAEQIAQVRQLVKKQLESLDLSIDQAEAAITEAKARGASAKAVEDLIAALDRLKKKRQEAEGKGGEAQEGVPKEKDKTPQQYLGEGLKAAQDRLKELMNIGYQVVEAANAIGEAFGEAFKGIASGSMTAQQALASFFQNVGDYFLDMAARMIAEWLKIQLIQGLTNFISGIFGGGFGGAPATSAGSLEGATGDFFVFPEGNILPAANGAVWKGGFQGFANGGMVTGPTMGLVGEGRYNEAIVPLPDGRSIPVELGGATGNQMNTNITVNVNNGQAQSNATGSNSSELGRKIEGAVKQVIVGELRPGGLLASR